MAVPAAGGIRRSSSESGLDSGSRRQYPNLIGAADAAIIIPFDRKSIPMRFDAFAMNQEGNPSLWILFRASLVAAVLLTTAVPSLSLAEKITAFGMPDSREGNCPTGQECGPASPGGRHQSIGGSGAAREYSTLGHYVKNYFAIGRISKRAAASGDGAGEETGDWFADIGSGGKDSDDIILIDDVTDYADSFGGMTDTSGNTILLADGAAPGHSPAGGPAAINYAAGAGGFASERYNAAGADSNRNPVAGRPPMPAPPKFDIGLDPFSSVPGRESYKADFWVRGQGGAPPAKAGNSAAADNMGTALEDSLYTGSPAPGGKQQDWPGPSKTRSYAAQSTSLSSGRDQGLSNLTFKGLFDFKDEQGKGETTSIVKLILVGVGVMQALILGAIVLRVLMGRGR